MVSPLPSEHCEGPVAVGRVLGVPRVRGVRHALPGVCVGHTTREVHVFTALDRTRATHYDGDAEYMCTCGALYSRRELLHLRHPSLQDLSVVDVSSVAFSPSSELLAR